MEDATDVYGVLTPRTSVASADRAIFELGGRQHDVVHRDHLIDLGLTRDAIRNRLKRGQLHLLYRSVYAVGRPDISADGRLLAATFAIGDGAVISHRAAAVLWGLRRGIPRIEVTITRQRRSRHGIRVHHAVLPPDEVTTLNGIPVTTVPRTILDNAAGAPLHEVERLIHEAEVQRLTDPLSLHDLLARYPRRPGTPAIRRVLEELELGAGISRSELEDRFRAFLLEYRLPRPERNFAVDVGPGRQLELDFAWPGQRLIAELDGRATHLTARSFERDRERDRALAVHGWTTIRVTWRQLHRRPGELARDLRALLTRTLAQASA